MNSYELSRNWFNFSFENPNLIKPIHSAIYFFAIEHCNRLGNKSKFGFPSQMTMDAIGVRKFQTYGKALNDLEEWGFISFIERSKNQYSANIISINAVPKNGKARGKALDKATIKHGAKQRQSTGQGMDSIDKPINQVTINQETIEPKKEYSQEVLQTFDALIKSFPDTLHPKNKDSWFKVIDELIRIDKIPIEIIINATKKAREDPFWCDNFMSIVKLRKKNKDGIPYITVFYEKFLKPKDNEINKRSNQKRTGATTDELAAVLADHFDKQRRGVGD